MTSLYVWIRLDIYVYELFTMKLDTNKFHRLNWVAVVHVCVVMCVGERERDRERVSASMCMCDCISACLMQYGESRFEIIEDEHATFNHSIDFTRNKQEKYLFCVEKTRTLIRTIYHSSIALGYYIQFQTAKPTNILSLDLGSDIYESLVDSINAGNKMPGHFQSLYHHHPVVHTAWIWLLTEEVEVCHAACFYEWNAHMAHLLVFLFIICESHHIAQWSWVN